MLTPFAGWLGFCLLALRIPTRFVETSLPFYLPIEVCGVVFWNIDLRATFLCGPNDEKQPAFDLSHNAIRLRPPTVLFLFGGLCSFLTLT